METKSQLSLGTLYEANKRLMSNKEILYEYALKAVERFESKKINIFENLFVWCLFTNYISWTPFGFEINLSNIFANDA